MSGTKQPHEMARKAHKVMKRDTRKKIPELLVPAGGNEQLRAAVSNGADAVYLSGSSFNARKNARNFSDAELREAIRFAHEYGVRVHIALNTLIGDNEFSEAIRFARFCRECGADALILQDRGLAAELMNQMPEMQFHLSTQGTVYDSDGAWEAYRAGFQRIILSRELSLNEIQAICSAFPGEIEIFVHGAICIAYSGQCHMSRVIGGRSGNRGTCAQPCRLPYTLCCDGEPCRGGDVSAPYLLSPADMCLVDHLDKIAQAGVSSLKIEGRMKSAQYVAIVTSVYRKYLDFIAEGRPVKLLERDRRKMESVFNRGGMTDAYLRGISGSELMSSDISKHRGILIGKVVSVDSGRRHITAQLTDKLSVGDGIEVRAASNGGNREVSGNVVTYLNNRGTMLKTAEPGMKVTVGDISGRIKSGARIFKITDSALMKEAEETYRKVPGTVLADMRLCAVEGRPLELTVSAGLYRFGGTKQSGAEDGPAGAKCAGENGQDRGEHLVLTVRSDKPLQRAEKRSPDEDKIRKNLKKTGGTPYIVGTCLVEIVGRPMIPVSLLNSLRRSALEQLTVLRLERMAAERQCAPDKADLSDAADALDAGSRRTASDVSASRIPDDFSVNRPKSRIKNGIWRTKGEIQRIESRIWQGENKIQQTAIHSHFDNRNRVFRNRISLFFHEMSENEDKIAEVAQLAARTDLVKNADGVQVPEITLLVPYRWLLSGRQEEYLGTAENAERCMAERYGQPGLFRIVPYLPPITRGFDRHELKKSAELIVGLYAQSRIAGAAVSHRGQMMLFFNEGKTENCAAFLKESNSSVDGIDGRKSMSGPGRGRIPLFFEENLHLYNKFAVAEAMQQRISRGVLSDELTDGGLERLVFECERSALKPTGGAFICEFTVFGRTAVMHTEHCVIGVRENSGQECADGRKHCYCRSGMYTLRDRKGEEFPVITDCSVCRMMILSHRKTDRREFGKRLRRRLKLPELLAARICVSDETPRDIMSLINSLM